ncbi:MAG: nucleotidyltransferase domain-containing protein [Actinomycetota bacterium]
MQERDVLRILDAFSRAGISTLLEGGWAIDALIGRQTREHRDLDVVVDRDELAAAARVLTDMGFIHDAGRKPGLPAQLVMVDGTGREADVHPVLIDEAHNGWQQLSHTGAWGLYSAEGTRGLGRIGGRSVRCTTPDLQVRHHLGYDLKAKDIRDLRLLREHFSVSIPPSCYRDVPPVELPWT